MAVPRETMEERRARLLPGATWLRTQREQRQWSQSELASRLGTTQDRVSAYERAQDEPPAQFARDVAREFGLDEYNVWRSLCLPLPAEVASRRRLISYAFSLMNDKDAEDLYEQVIAYVRTRRSGGKAGGAQVKPTRVTRPGGSPSLGSQGEESAV
jgi:transcriptional regulator with XRE-family HTH domain